jgi:hypothetical protein
MLFYGMLDAEDYGKYYGVGVLKRFWTIYLWINDDVTKY